MPGSKYAAQVGALITARRAELGWTQEQLAERVGASVRTVGSAERGTSAVAAINRPRWEEVLGWPPGTLTNYYRHGVRERPGPGGGTPGASVLDRAEVPAEYRDDPTVREILESTLNPDQQVEILRAWMAQRAAEAATIRHMLEGFRRAQ